MAAIISRGEGRDIEEHEYGKFAWIMDPNGIKIELWEPAGEPGG